MEMRKDKGRESKERAVEKLRPAATDLIRVKQENYGKGTGQTDGY